MASRDSRYVLVGQEDDEDDDCSTLAMSPQLHDLEKAELPVEDVSLEREDGAASRAAKFYRQTIRADDNDDQDSIWGPMMTPEHSFVPSIEGLRGLAVLLTEYCHFAGEMMPREVAGAMGVTIFFVLSGYLISGVLIRSQRAYAGHPGGFTYRHLPRFYANRFMRLYPALLAVLIIVYIIISRRGTEDMVAVRHYFILALLYLSNWRSLQVGFHGLGPWANMWSLALEEQFYIGWSLLLPVLCFFKYRLRCAIVILLICVSLWIRIWVSIFQGSLWGIDWHLGLPANVWKMLIGSSLRLIRLPQWTNNHSTAYMGLLGLSLIIFFSCITNQPENFFGNFAPGWNVPVIFARTWSEPCSAFFAAMILTGISGPSGGLPILEGRSIRFFGKISYAWYLWQVPLLKLYNWERVHVALGDTAIAMACAMMSTFWLEEPIARWYKNRSGISHR